ncbi:MAG: LTA synthase family protein [Candidatus Marinimicrobia bacterium]|nr:LTA synthase family protein [Candidatus Neomarinimicrobiota bacterium]
MAGWRGVFIISNLSNIQFDDFFLFLQSFPVALRLDAVTASYLILPIWITMFIPKLGWQSSINRSMVTLYLLVISFLYGFFCIVDLYFFQEMGSHLNFMAWQPSAKSGETLSYIWKEYPILIIVAILSLISWFWIKLPKIFILHGKIKRPIYAYVLSFVFSVIFIGTCIRGGWQERPIDWGHAMFSSNHLANQAALNPLFNFGRSVIQMQSEKNLSGSLHFMEHDSAGAILRDLIKTEGESFIAPHGIQRRIENPQGIQPNIVLVVLESFLASNCGFINPEMEGVTPNLNQIANEGVNCKNTFANGKRSAYGLSSILCSWPVLPGYPIISQLETQGGVETIASLLKNTGYSTHFIYGGDADFDNMKGFAIANGFDEVHDREKFSTSTPGNMWGVYDEYIFDYAASILQESEQPNFLTLFTTTNHQPWQVPADKESIIPEFDTLGVEASQVLRTMAYTDHCIGKFFRKNRTKKWMENTLFLFIADHGINVFKGQFEDPRNAHIPFLIYGPWLIASPQVIASPASQVDVAPTLLHLIGYPHPFRLLGSNVLAADYTGVSCRVVNDYAMWIEQKFLLSSIMNKKPTLSHLQSIYEIPYTEIKDESKITPVEKHLQAYMQSAYFLFKGGQTD